MPTGVVRHRVVRTLDGSSIDQVWAVGARLRDRGVLHQWEGFTLIADGRFAEVIDEVIEEVETGAIRAADVRPDLDRTPAATGIVAGHDSWVLHFVRMTGTGVAMSLSIYACFAGLFWYAHALSKVGYRKRDLPLLFIPIYGWYLGVVVGWRYTARHPYWRPRHDRPSGVLSGWRRPTAAIAGWLAVPLFAALGFVAVSVFGATSGWTEADRAELREVVMSEGVPASDADCVVAVVEVHVKEPVLATDVEWGAAMDAAAAYCLR